MESKNQEIIGKAAEAFPLFLDLYDSSHSTRLVLKHIKKKMESINIYANKSVVFSCNAIVEMKGSVSSQHLMRHKNTFYSISAQFFIKNVTFWINRLLTMH